MDLLTHSNLERIFFSLQLIYTSPPPPFFLADKKKLVFDARHMHAQEMVDDINKHSKTLQLQEEIKQAS